MTRGRAAPAPPAGKTVGYVRVSTPDQNVDRQVAELGPVDRVYTDQMSGAKGVQRPALAEMLNYVRDGDTVRVSALDRLGRSFIDLERIVAELLEKGVRIEFVANRLTFVPGEDDPYGTLMRHMLSSFAQFERAMIRDRQRGGIEAAKARGVYKGRRPALTPEQADEARNRYKAGESMPGLAAAYGCSRRVIYDVVHRAGVYAPKEAAPPQMRGAESVALPFEPHNEPTKARARRRRSQPRKGA